MLHFNDKTISKKELIEAAGNNKSVFHAKKSMLKKKWEEIAKYGIGDCHEVRIISPILFRKLTPINVAIIADNLQYFKEKYVTSPEVNKEKLEIACLCGSENIANFLLKPVKKPISYYSFMLPYVAASMNEKWIEKIALEMKQKNIPMPDNIYNFSDIKTINMIKNIFNDDKPSNRI